MSTELTIRMWNDKRISPQLQLFNMIEIFENHGISQNNWKGLTVRTSDLSKKVLQLQEPLSYKQIADILAKYEQASDELHFSISSAIQCWRFDGATPVQGFVPFWLEAWGNVFASSFGRCRQVEGDAAFSLANSGPFVALIEPKNDPRVQQVNRHIEENLK